MFKKFTQWFDNPPPKNAPLDRGCDYPGCKDPGFYRAPKSQNHLENCLNEWYWLCLPHIREYNNSWNYYANMSEEEINKERLNDVTWDRPSWSLNGSSAFPHCSFQDPFGFFGTEQSRPNLSPLPNADQEALKLLGLTIPFTKEQLQANYRHLVKQHHPDANQRDPRSEEMIRLINQAYSHLQKFGK